MPAEERALTFWHASEDGEVKVIGDEPATPTTIRVRQWKLISQGKDTSRAGVSSLDINIKRPTIGVPCGEANRKAECRKAARSV